MSSKLSPACGERAQQRNGAYSSVFTGRMTDPEDGEASSADPCQSSLPLLSVHLLLLELKTPEIQFACVFKKSD